MKVFVHFPCFVAYDIFLIQCRPASG